MEPSPESSSSASPQPAVPARAVEGSRAKTPPQPVLLVEPRRRGWTRWLSWLGWAGLLVCIPIIAGMTVAYHDYYDRSHGIRERFHSGAKSGQDKIAIIKVSGVILDGNGFVKDQIDRVREDDQVKGVVVRIDSPGGTVSGSDYIYHHLKRLREERHLPMVVSMGSVAASGGYYVAMAVGDAQDVIFAEPTTTTGSIGVIIPHYDLSGLLDRYHVKDDSIATNPRKQLLSMTRPMSEDDRQVVDRYLNLAFDRFKQVVKAGRPKFQDDPQSLDQVATGEFFAAQTALGLGLIDKLGFMEEAIDRVAELAKVDVGKVRVVQFDPPASVLGALGIQIHSRAANPLTQLYDAQTPRAYYLWTLVPPVWSTPR